MVFTMNIGDLLTLVSAVMLAFHITITGIVAKDDSSVDLVFLQMITGAILSIISTFVFKEVHVVTTTGMLVILYLGVFCTMLAFLLQTIGQRYAHATQAAMILSTESLFGPIFAILILGETLGPRLVIGGAIIFTAIFLSEYEFKSPNKSKE
jgi:drug/metabolite transporter (DMT)-like permease